MNSLPFILKTIISILLIGIISHQISWLEMSNPKEIRIILRIIELEVQIYAAIVGILGIFLAISITKLINYGIMIVNRVIFENFRFRLFLGAITVIIAISLLLVTGRMYNIVQPLLYLSTYCCLMLIMNLNEIIKFIISISDIKQFVDVKGEELWKK